MKQLWTAIINSLGGLKTPERRLLFGLMLMVIVVLWLSFKDNYSDLKARINELENKLDEVTKAKETQRILLQDKIDACHDERYKDVKEFMEQAEAAKNKVKSLK